MPKITAKGHSSKSQNFCKYIHRYCFQENLQGFQYCVRHILEDKSAPFRQCTYVEASNKKRCTNATPKPEKIVGRDSTLCPWHAKKTLQKTRVSASQPKSAAAAAEGPTALLRDLEHHCNRAAHDAGYDRDTGLSEKYDSAPFGESSPSSLGIGVDTHKEKRKKEGIMVSDTRIDIVDQYAGPAYSLDDNLRHAGVYTAMEVLKIAREKTVRLQAVYLEKLRGLFYENKQIRSKYLAAIKENRRKCVEKKTAKEEKRDNIRVRNGKTLFAKKLHSLKRYHRPKGVEKILRRRTEEKRAEILGIPITDPSICTFIEDGKQCGGTALFLTKFCLNHILFDPKQVMFRPCGSGKKGDCLTPVVPLEENAVCDLHLHHVLLKSAANTTVRSLSTPDSVQEQEHFQSMDDIASLGLDVVTPGSLFGLDQFGEPGESTDTVPSEDQADLMQIQPIPLNPPADILCDSRKSGSEEEK